MFGLPNSKFEIRNFHLLNNNILFRENKIKFHVILLRNFIKIYIVSLISIKHDKYHHNICNLNAINGFSYYFVYSPFFLSLFLQFNQQQKCLMRFRMKSIGRHQITAINLMMLSQYVAV